MHALITLRNVAKAFGADHLFRDISLAIGRDERVGLIGVNGSGKSTLLKILAGAVAPDAGARVVQKGAVVAYLSQEDDIPLEAELAEVVAAPLLPLGLPETELYTRVEVSLGKAGFTDRRQRAGALSGGWRKRLALARELAKEPDVLLLDEPTNHLDLDSILWLEQLLPALGCGYVVVSHDRYFLERATSRTIELGPCYPEGFLSVDASYVDFLEKRVEYLQACQNLEQSLANRVRREIEWLRRGPKARTTKAKFRVEEAGRLQEQLAETRRMTAQQGRAGVDFSATERKTKRLLTAEGLRKAVGDATLFSELDLILAPGTRLGLVGPNGSGKTTLLKTLAGELKPDAGRVTQAPELQVVVFDQDREALDTEQTLRRALAPEGDTVVYRGRPLHVASWAKRFLFSPEQLPLPVARLSGGEQARILIARLMLQPADVLFLDEPTNNLDIATLEALEESLLDFPGAVVLITHDRFLMDRVATSIVGLDGCGGAAFYADFEQWRLACRDAQRARAKAEAAAKSDAPPPSGKPKPKKLTYKEQMEFDAMEATIEAAESHVETAQAALEDPAIAADSGELAARLRTLEQAQATVEALYARWEALEAKRAGQDA